MSFSFGNSDKKLLEEIKKIDQDINRLCIALLPPVPPGMRQQVTDVLEAFNSLKNNPKLQLKDGKNNLKRKFNLLAERVEILKASFLQVTEGDIQKPTAHDRKRPL